jgi:hypothetical protein
VSVVCHSISTNFTGSYILQVPTYSTLADTAITENNSSQSNRTRSVFDSWSSVFLSDTSGGFMQNSWDGFSLVKQSVNTGNMLSTALEAISEILVPDTRLKIRCEG